jgi:5-methylcytosine-specific restriction endonuclease McrA
MLGLRTLVLNNNYMPISLFPLHTIPAEDAITRVFNGTCRVVADYDRKILTPTHDIKWPSIVARIDSMRIKEVVRLRRESLYYRDHGRCAYCEKPLTISELTYDHVVPQSQGGGSDWENVVAACPSCNSNKGDARPVGQWTPKWRPYRPTYYQLLAMRRKFPITVDHSSWIDFLGDWEAEIKVRFA